MINNDQHFNLNILLFQVADGELEPALMPLLRRQFTSNGPRRIVQIGDKQVDYSDAFRLVLCTRNEQIRLPEHISAVVNEVLSYYVMRLKRLGIPDKFCYHTLWSGLSTPWPCSRT